jgi:succinyl-diaminopimelate desuccinylase
MTEKISSLLSALVSFRSTEDEPEEKQHVAAFVAQWLERTGIDFDFHPHETAPSIVANLPGTGDPILLLTHLDVVPASDDMFRMTVKDGRCYGRGVIDDKGSAAIILLLLEELSKWEDRPGIRAVFATDEEIGSRDGVVRLLDMGVLEPARAVIALDGGTEDVIMTRGKGVYHFMLRCRGTSVHGSRPWEGDNAIEKAMRIYERIKKAMDSERQQSPLHWHETVSIGSIQGGEFVNQVPAFAMAKIDIRFTDAHTVDSIRALIDAQLEPDTDIELIGTGECFQTDEADPLLNAYITSMNKQGLSVQTEWEHGATDARFFSRLGVPIWVHDPLGGDLHTDNEWLDLASAGRVLEGLKEFCRSIRNV